MRSYETFFEQARDGRSADILYRQLDDVDLIAVDSASSEAKTALTALYTAVEMRGNFFEVPVFFEKNRPPFGRGLG